MIRTQIIAGTVCLLSLFAAGAAHAEESPTAGHASVAGLLGYGFKDGVGLGLGVRGGYTLPMNVYIGGTLVYHLGKSEGGFSEHIAYVGVEGGYDLVAGPVVVRPYVGLGDAIVTVKSDVPGFGSISGSSGNFAVWPGASVLYPLGSAFVGGDARFLIVNDFNAFSLFATAGYQF